MQVFESIVPDDETIPASLSGASSFHRVSLSGTSSIQLLIEYNRIPGSVKGNNGRGHDLLTNEVKVQLLMACRCSSLLFPATRLFPRRSAGRRLFIACHPIHVYCSRRPFIACRRVYCSRLLFIECRCSIQPFKSIVRASTRLLFAFSIVRVSYCVF